MKVPNDVMESQMDRLINLTEHLLVLELYKGGVNKADIGKHLKLAKQTVVKMLKGYEKSGKRE
jgi:DNA-binding MarR family transcriptional regulator